jgi:hypothetical protein
LLQRVALWPQQAGTASLFGVADNGQLLADAVFQKEYKIHYLGSTNFFLMYQE